MDTQGPSFGMIEWILIGLVILGLVLLLG